jgi:hypothetical protein
MGFRKESPNVLSYVRTGSPDTRANDGFIVRKFVEAGAQAVLLSVALDAWQR